MVFRYRKSRPPCNGWGIRAKWIIRERPSNGVWEPRPGDLRKDSRTLNEIQRLSFCEAGFVILELHLSADLNTDDGSFQCNQGAVVVHILTTLA